MSKPKAIYARYSSHKQDRSASIEVQLESCRRAIGQETAMVYIDRAVTGTTMDRPAFNRMLADAESKLFSTVYVYKFDRFGRSAYAHAIVADLEAIGVKVISATEGDDPLSRGIQLVVAEDYSRKLSERCKAGQRRRFIEGVYVAGTPAFGYQLNGGRLSIEPGEADAVRRIYERYAAGTLSLREAAAMLDSMGFKPRRAHAWNLAGVQKMLSNDLYCGVRKYNEIRLRDESLRIIGDDLWDRVRERNSHRREIRRKPRDVCAFTGLLYCGCCGWKFRRRVDHYHGKDYPAKWVCGQRQTQAAALCDRSAIVVEHDLIAKITAIFEPILDNTDSIVEAAVEHVHKQLNIGREATRNMAQRVAAADAEIERMIAVLSSGHMPDASAIRAVSARLAERQRERDELAQAMDRAGAASSVAVDSLRANIKAEMDRFRTGLMRPTCGAAINAILRDAMGEATVMPGGELTERAAPVTGSPRRSGHSHGVIRGLLWASLRAA